MKKSFILCFLALVFTTTATEAQRKQLRYETENVTLTGRIVYRTFYGPPNYGETPKEDARESQPILMLDSAIDVIGKPNDEINETERGVKAITLVSEQMLRPFVGKRVSVQGSLFHAHTGHHHTKVLMSVSSVKRR